MIKNKLPEGWKLKKLRDVCNFIGGGTPSKNISQYWNGNIPWASIKDIKGQFLHKTFDYISAEGLKNSATNTVMPNEIILATRINPGRPIISKIESAINQDLKIVRPRIVIETLYLYYAFLNYERDVLKLSSGTTVQGITLNALNDLDFPIPPIAIQQAIVSKIEELFSDIDKGIEDLKIAQQQLKVYRQSVLKWAFEGRLTNEVKDKELPASWKWTTLKDITSLLGDGLHGTPKYDITGEYYFINGNNLADGKIKIKNNTKKVSLEEFNKYKKQLNDQTVLVSINGTLGYTAFYNNEPVILGKSACYFNLKNGIDKNYIRYILTSQRFTNYSLNSATGTTIKNISLKTMREFTIPLPPSNDEQNKVVREIESRLSVADKMEESIKKSLQQAEALRQSVLKKAFSGELI